VVPQATQDSFVAVAAVVELLYLIVLHCRILLLHESFLAWWFLVHAHHPYLSGIAWFLYYSSSLLGNGPTRIDPVVLLTSAQVINEQSIIINLGELPRAVAVGANHLLD